jgi:hypothetical protein
MTINTPRIFGQIKPTDTDQPNLLYTVQLGTRAQVTIFVCNQENIPEFFRIALIPNGQGFAAARYIAWDTPLIGNAVFSVSGIGMNQGDSIWVKSNSGNLSFTATGIELS